MNPSPFTDAAIEFIDTLLARINHETAVQNCSELDGFLTAIVSSPEAIMPSTWLNAIWGDWDPQGIDQAEINRFIQLLIDQMNFIGAALIDGTDDFDPLYFEYEEDGKTLIDAEEWCLGYMRAVELCADQWEQLPEAEAGELATITYFAGPEQFTGAETLTPDELEELKNHLHYAAQSLYTYWLNQRTNTQINRTPFIRDTAKIGRNDPCVCGSGKKFKKCCG